MANSYGSFHYHIVFSTKNRIPYISQDIEQRVRAYIGGVARKHRMTALEIGGIEDHIQALVTAPAPFSPSEIAKYLKGDCSKWIHAELPRFGAFGWQDGYAGFSVSKSNLPAVIRYIRNQREHHRKRTFQEEYRELLDKHGIEYDERYLWG
ncbi:MAG: IS200/IS605 family transposase [Blastocatellia bacterium]